MIITMMPSAAFAEDTVNYRLWIGGVRVTSAHMSEINEAGEGWIYEGDGKQGTLTLTDANITGNHGYTAGYYNANVYSDDINLTINLVGNNTVTNKEKDGNGIVVHGGTLTIKGDGKLTVVSNNYGIENTEGLTLDNANITVNSGYHCIYLQSDAMVNTIDGGEYELTSTGGNGINCYHPLTIRNADLTVKSEDQGIEGSYDIKINDSTVDIESTGHNPAVYTQGNIEIKNSIVKKN